MKKTVGETGDSSTKQDDSGAYGPTQTYQIHSDITKAVMRDEPNNNSAFVVESEGVVASTCIKTKENNRVSSQVKTNNNDNDQSSFAHSPEAKTASPRM